MYIVLDISSIILILSYIIVRSSVIPYAYYIIIIFTISKQTFEIYLIYLHYWRFLFIVITIYLTRLNGRFTIVASIILIAGSALFIFVYRTFQWRAQLGYTI